MSFQSLDPKSELTLTGTGHPGDLSSFEHPSAVDRIQRALLNILGDSEVEKAHLQGAQRAVINILEDSEWEKENLQGAQRAAINILEDSEWEKENLQGAQRAVINILEDSEREKENLQGAQRAVINILDDFDSEKSKVEIVNLKLGEQINERQRAQEEISRLNRTLEQRVAERTAELAASNQELEAFTYSVAHDLRAPLRHAQGFSRSVLEDFGGQLPQAGQDYLHDIVKSTQHMGQLIDGLLGLAGIGRQEPRLEVTSLEAIVQEVLRGLKADVKDRDMSWQIGDLPFVECDPGLMKQVFYNLIANAVKYTRPRHPAVIEVGQIAHDGQPAIFVKDNGVGFSMKYSGKLFGVFQRLHRREDFEGTGVGLATVQRIVRKHGGRIWAEAELDKGAAFYFTLATPQPDQSQAQPTIAAKAEER